MDYSIEEKEDGFAVYSFDQYGPSSVLAGQTRKSFITWFEDLEKAQVVYPDAELGYRCANNSFDHLPDEENDFERFDPEDY